MKAAEYDVKKISSNKVHTVVFTDHCGREGGWAVITGGQGVGE
jgi:hypothetical protein